MEPVTSGLQRFHAPVKTGAAHACRSPHSCRESSAQEPANTPARAVKKALIQHVVATLRARLEVAVSSPAKVAGLTESEQASNQLANAVSSALQSPASAEEVRATVEDGLQQAAASLQQAGAGGSDLDSALAELTDKLNGLFAALAPASESSSEAEVTGAGARIVTKEKGVLEIRTQEGDVVRVKFATRTDVRAGSAAVATSDGTLSSSHLSIASRSRAEISVRGDLSADELQAIERVVQKVDALADEFFAGNVDEALAKAADLDIDTEQLANVALRLSMKQRIEAAAVRVCDSPSSMSTAPVQHAPACAEVAAGAPPAPVLEAAPASDSTAAVPEADGAASEPVAQAPSADAAPADSAAIQSSAAEPEPSSPQAVIAKFVSSLLVAFQATEGATRMDLSFKMKLQLLTVAIEAKQPEPAPESQYGVAKLCEVAETAAAQ